jgi:putative YpdA family bacillithiol system oxidoreductase
MTPVKEFFDVLIIGAGPIGLNCGIVCKKNGLSYLIVDKGTLVNSIYNYPLNMTFFSTADKLEIGDVPFISHSPKPTRSEALEYYRRVTLHWDLNISLYEKVERVNKLQVGFHVITEKDTYQCKNLIISTGFYDEPNLMGIPGERLNKVHHYYREAHPYFGKKIIVVGAANSAVDVAMETWRKGADVTMVIRGKQIKESVKYWIRPDIENRIIEGAIKVFYNASLSEIRPFEVDIETENGTITMDNDFVLAMTGYLPDFSFLQSLGVEIGNDEMQTPVHDPQTMMTNVEGIYLAGVICGGLKTNKWFIENSRIHAEIIINHLTNKKLFV